MSSSDALQAGSALVSSFDARSAGRTLIFWISFGLPPGSPGSLQVASASRPDEVLGVCAEYVPANVETNCGLASCDPTAAASDRAADEPQRRAGP